MASQVQKHWVWINNISYAGIEVLIEASSPPQLQRMKNSLNTESKKFGMLMNIRKHKVMLIKKSMESKPFQVVIYLVNLE